MIRYISVFLFLIANIAIAFPQPDEKKDQGLNHDSQEHYPNKHHNTEYDHEAFLGEDEAKTFDQLTPEESRRRLGLIVDKIDNDKNGFVSHEELKDWIKYTQKRYIHDDVERQWRQQNPDNNPTITFEQYKKAVYGFMEQMNENDLENEESGFSYANMLRRDKRRWSVADRDGDNQLTRDEFTAFLHPEDTEHMKDLVVLEALEDIDKDQDGKISIDEYIGDMYKSEEGELEPEWVKTEREQFATYRDKDHDNYLNLEEVRNWISPQDFDHAEAETRHLIYEADSDADQQLTKDEILNKYDLFVGSQATDFGEALARHDEF